MMLAMPENDFDQEREAILQEFARGSERAAVLVLTATLDKALQELITGLLQPSPNRSDELLDGDAPLSTFSARIAMAYRLGAIDAEFARALHLVRKVRNDFAHDIVGCSLDTGPHRDRVRELARAVARSPLYTGLHELVATAKKSPAMSEFGTSTLIMMGMLQRAVLEVKRLDVRTTPLVDPTLQPVGGEALPPAAPASS